MLRNSLWPRGYPFCKIISVGIVASCNTLHRPPPEIFTLLNSCDVASNTVTSIVFRVLPPVPVPVPVPVRGCDDDSDEDACMAENIPLAPPPITEIDLLLLEYCWLKMGFDWYLVFYDSNVLLISAAEDDDSNNITNGDFCFLTVKDFATV